MNGLWTAEFGSSAGAFGGGVVVFDDGEILGGDATYYYVGNYTLAGRDFEATLKSSPFVEGARSVFNTVGQELILQLKGSLVDDGKALAHGSADGAPGLTFAIRLTKRS